MEEFLELVNGFKLDENAFEQNCGCFLSLLTTASRESLCVELIQNFENLDFRGFLALEHFSANLNVTFFEKSNTF